MPGNATELGPIASNTDGVSARAAEVQDGIDGIEPDVIRVDPAQDFLVAGRTGEAGGTVNEAAVLGSHTYTWRGRYTAKLPWRGSEDRPMSDAMDPQPRPDGDEPMSPEDVTMSPTTEAGRAMARRTHVHFTACPFARGPLTGMEWPAVTACECGALREIRAIEKEARAPLQATVEMLRGVVDECRRLANPGVESDAPTDGRGQRLNRIYRITTKATPATVEHIDGLGCWCRPYRDGIEPNLIVHRKAEEA